MGWENGEGEAIHKDITLKHPQLFTDIKTKIFLLPIASFLKYYAEICNETLSTEIYALHTFLEMISNLVKFHLAYSIAYRSFYRGDHLFSLLQKSDNANSLKKCFCMFLG